MLWDYIVVGGGIGGSVVSNRLLTNDSSLQILVIEAGPNANDDPSVVWPNSTNTVGGTYDWNYTYVPQVHADNRSVTLAAGKALGGGTVINLGMWSRGDKAEYDIWGSIVNDSRWGYDGQLPYMKKTEAFWNASINQDQHGLDGNVFIQSGSSIDREFPLRNYTLESWEALGVDALPFLDANAGNNLGIGEYTENKHDGRREIAAAVYPLDGITVLTETMVEKVLFTNCSGGLAAKGVQLANGTQILGRQTILSAGAIRTPQILMLSGIGPADELTKHGIQVHVDAPEVGQNFRDHGLFRIAWQLKNPEDGWAVGSSNPLFSEPQYSFGTAADFVVCTTVPKDGLARAIEEDEGIAPDWTTHPLLKTNRTFFEHIFISSGSKDGSAVASSAVAFQQTSVGNVTLASAVVTDAPLINPNYLGTAVDRYVFREGLRQEIAFAVSNATVLGRDIIAHEIQGAGFDEPLSVNSTDDYLDARLRAGIRSVYHAMGSAAMGKVVDTDLKVRGVSGLRVVDASVLPVGITAHLQVAIYALAEQAAVIIASQDTTKRVELKK